MRLTPRLVECGRYQRVRHERAHVSRQRVGAVAARADLVVGVVFLLFVALGGRVRPFRLRRRRTDSTRQRVGCCRDESGDCDAIDVRCGCDPRRRTGHNCGDVGSVGGLGSGIGNVCIYRGLAGGRMAVVAPLSAIAAAAVPVLVGTLAGEQPRMFQYVGVLAALPAIWLVSGGGWRLPDAHRADIVNGLVAGLGFGVQFSALGQVGSHAGLMPLAISQIVSVMTIVIGAIAMSASWFPSDRFSRLGASRECLPASRRCAFNWRFSKAC